MSIFTIKNGKLVIVPENLTIPELKLIFDRDETVDKKKAYLELCFIYHSSDFKSPYNNMEEELRVVQLKKDFFSDTTWTPDDDVKKAIIKYKLLQETPSMRLLISARKAINKVQNYFDSVDLQERTDKGMAVNKITELTNSMGNIGKIVESVDKLEERVKKEQLKETKIRGNKEISDYERV